ncbi:dTDP-4-dehydrorhamnose 3,5-epimerase [Maribacter arenosus]|uniref:dTDP-4-dehydrorhamnose 3,5-epimerase n=1 Tax=Maribacter arenosus TaxID=1854708 RepID=A0ABR7VA97_9FLAO|nr:dTDP-4-dehydrorhamnose 3,5-epimerase [Maribacter arenosus]MBD0850594.1 dTDP-4-dehydrorhamnose 3,5-epimerase [Maribacter arenosus]
MKYIETKLKGCFIIEPSLFNDDRGLFYESYKKVEFEDQLGERVDFVQDNVSISKKGVLRGLHFQNGIHAQAKLVQVIKGEALDVVVDLRKNSPSYKKHFKIRLSENDHKLLFIPKGMAHGFLALEDNTVFVYKCDNYYDKASEAGIIYNDIDLNIDWVISADKLILSKKDLVLPTMKDLNI